MLKWLHEQFLLSGFFIMLIMFSMNMLYAKVVDNFHILLVLAFHDFRLANLRVIDFASS
jgi:hypothetical protein